MPRVGLNCCSIHWIVAAMASTCAAALAVQVSDILGKHDRAGQAHLISDTVLAAQRLDPDADRRIVAGDLQPRRGSGEDRIRERSAFVDDRAAGQGGRPGDDVVAAKLGDRPEDMGAVGRVTDLVDANAGPARALGPDPQRCSTLHHDPLREDHWLAVAHRPGSRTRESSACL